MELAEKDDIKLDSEQMETLLKESKEHFQKRNLKKALTAAQIALDFARKAAIDIYIIRAGFLLARIYSTNGRYTGDGAYFEKAMTILDDIANSHFSTDTLFSLRLLRAKGEVLTDKGEYAEARQYFYKALEMTAAEGWKERQVRLLSLISMTELLQGDTNAAYPIALKALDIYHSDPLLEKDKNLRLEVFNQVGQVYAKKYDYSKALEYSQEVLKLARELNDMEKELSALNAIAVVSGVKSNYKIAMQYFQEALDKSEAIGFRDNIANCLINIGTIYAHLYNYEDALTRYGKALEHHRSALDDHTEVIIYNNVGNIYYITGKYEEAEKLFLSSLKIARENNFREEMALSLAQLSRTYTARENIAAAETYAKEASGLIDELGMVNGRQINLLNLADIHLHQGKTQDAIALAKEGIEASRSLFDDASEIRGYEFLSNLYKAEGIFEKAYDFLAQYARKKEEFSKHLVDKQFLDLEIKNALKEKQKEIEQLTRENEYQALLLEKGDKIRKQNQELLQMNEDLKQFAYVASHDLKEPLRMVGSYVNVISEMYGNKFEGNISTYFGYITEGVSRMNELLDALLKYATVGNEEPEPEEADLNEIIELCQHHLHVLIQETGATIQSEKLPVIRSGRSMLIHLFQNLLSNAIKFRKPGKKPEIKISAKRMGQEVIVKIKDNGIGIDPDNQERIFVIFQRLHARSQYEGTGIGLAICQKIVQRLGGRIWVESEKGKGATFLVALPTNTEP